MATVLKGGTIVSSKKSYLADIRIDGEYIVAIDKEVYVDGDEIVDVSGCYLLPGGIDVHTHFDLDIGSTVTADSFESGTKAALAGGTTTIIDFVNHKRGQSFFQCLDYYNKLSNNKCYCDYGFHMTITEWNKKLEEEMKRIVAEGITTFKMYMAYKNILQVEDDIIKKALAKAKELGVLLSFHCEDGDIVYKNINMLLRQGKTDVIYHEKSREAYVELVAVKKLLDISYKVDYPVYIVHLSSKIALDEVRRRRALGAKVIVETCPQYLLLNKSLYEGSVKDAFNGAKYVMSPPLRDLEDNEALWDGIKNGEISVLATDHCSFNYLVQKELGKDDFSKIPNGAPGVENRIALTYTYGVLENKISINKLVEITSENPAKIFGLYPTKGTLKVGSYGDILVIKEKSGQVITWKDQVQKVDYNPYEGYRNSMEIITVYLRGKEVVRNNKVITDKPLGKFQKRTTFNMED